MRIILLALILALPVATAEPQSRDIWVSVTNPDAKGEVEAVPITAPHFYFSREGVNPGKGLLGPCKQLITVESQVKEGVTFRYPVMKLDCKTTILTLAGVNLE
jgi:hypothetical protein